MERKFRVLSKEFIVDDKMELYINLQKKELTMIQKAHELIETMFIESDSIEILLNSLSDAITKLDTALVDSAVNILLDNGIFTMDSELYFEKYYSDFFDCSGIIAPLVEKYIEITRTEVELANYRDYLKASRKKWSGGGFGIKGAIKGAISAEIMNMGMGFIHSLGDHTKKVNDEYAIKKLKDELLTDSETKNIMDNAIESLIEGWFNSLIIELSEHNVLEMPNYDIGGAKAIMNNLGKRENSLSVEKKLELLGEVFLKNPFYYPLYEFVLSTDLKDMDDNLEFAEYIGYMDIYKTERKNKEDLAKAILYQQYEPQIMELKEKSGVVVSNNEIEDILREYVKIQENSGMDLHEDIEKAIFNRFTYLSDNDVEELINLYKEYSKKLPNVNFNKILQIIDNRKETALGLRKKLEDCQRFEKEIIYPANFMNIYELAIKGYEPAQEAICNQLLLINKDYYYELEEHYNENKEDKCEEIASTMIQMIVCLLPINKQYAKECDKQIINSSDFDAVNAINNQQYDIYNGFHKFLFYYMQLIDCVNEKDLTRECLDKIIELAQFGNPSACYFLGKYCMKNSNMKDKIFDTAIEYLCKAADSGFLSAAIEIIQAHERKQDLINAKFYSEKYIGENWSDYNKLSMSNLLSGLIVYYDEWLNYFKFYMVGILGIERESMYMGENSRHSFNGVFKSLNWLMLDSSSNWKYLCETNKIKISISDLGIGLEDYCIESNTFNNLKYFERALWLFKNKITILITNYAIYYNNNEIKLKELNSNKISEIHEVINGDEEFVNIKDEITNCIYWAKYVFDMGDSDGCAKILSGIQYNSQLKRIYKEELHFNTVIELQARYYEGCDWDEVKQFY